MAKKCWRTMVTVEVLSYGEEPPVFKASNNGLLYVHYSIDEGDCSGNVEMATEEVSKERFIELSLAQGTTPDFFGEDFEEATEDDVMTVAGDAQGEPTRYVRQGGVLCVECGEAVHIYGCSKSPGITAEQWQDMSDDERLAAEKAADDASAECPRCHDTMSAADDAECQSKSCVAFRTWAATQPQDGDA